MTLVDHDYIGEICGRLEAGLALVRTFGRALCLRRWIVPLLLDDTDIASVLPWYCTTKAHRAVIFAIGQLYCSVVISQNSIMSEKCPLPENYYACRI